MFSVVVVGGGCISIGSFGRGVEVVVYSETKLQKRSSAKKRGPKPGEDEGDRTDVRLSELISTLLVPQTGPFVSVSLLLLSAQAAAIIL